MPIKTVVKSHIFTLTGIRDAAETPHHATLRGEKTISFPVSAIFSVETVVVRSETGIYVLKIDFYGGKPPMCVPINPNDQETAVRIFTRQWADALKGK